MLLVPSHSGTQLSVMRMGLTCLQLKKQPPHGAIHLLWCMLRRRMAKPLFITSTVVVE